MSELKKVTLVVILTIAVIAILTAFLHSGPTAEWKGTDEEAVNMIGELSGGYEPWFTPILEPPGAEMESFLFSIQAAIGAGIVGYIAGYYSARKKRDD